MSKLQVDTIVDKEDKSAPTFSKGAIVTGVTTSTTFSGNLTGNVTGTLTGTASGLAGSPDITVGQVTAGEGFRATSGGIVVTGVSTVNSSLISQVNAGECQIRAGYSTTKYAQIGRASSGAYQFISQENGASLEFGTAESADGGGAAKFYIDRYGDVSVGIAATIKAGGSATFAGIVTATSFSDSNGTLRSLPVNSQTSAYSLVTADAGKMVKITTGGVTCPNGQSFAAGDMISIMNESGSAQTITQGGGATLYWTADGTTGNRTLGARGVATIVMAGSSAFYISGSGLT